MKRRSSLITGSRFVSIICALLFNAMAFGHDITDKLSIGGVLAGTPQYLDVDDVAKAAVVFQPEISFRPYEKSEFFAKFGFSPNNGINNISPFALTIWAADLEDDVKNINGSNRDYLLTAWAKHTFEFGESHSLLLTGGIIDSTDYVDENAFANDEYNQFMNEAFDNAPTGNFASYDIGGVVQWVSHNHNFNANALLMDGGKNEDGNNYKFYAFQLAYRLKTALGEGNYRITGSLTSDDFLDADGENSERLSALTLSFDQQLGKITGVFLRLGIQGDKAAVTWARLYSGGLNISGAIWGRKQDNIGIGVAYLDDGNTDLDNSLVTEAYVRFALSKAFAATADFQYLADNVNGDKNPHGWVGSIRITAEF